MTFIRVDDQVRLFVQDLGHGSPVVLVAGFGMDHQVWDRQVRILSARHRVICVDQRGHGLSDKPLAGYDLDQLAHDLLTVLEVLGLKNCTLVGWSFGGQVAFRAASLDQTGRIAHLALVGSNAVRASRSSEFPFGLPPELLEAQLIDAESSDRITSRRVTIRSGFCSDVNPDTVDWLLSRSLLMPSWAAISCYHTMFTSDQTNNIDRVVVPVLQVIGVNDPVHSAKGARWLNERLANSRLVEIADCGHYPMIEAAEAFDRVLGGFADGIEDEIAQLTNGGVSTEHQRSPFVSPPSSL